MSFSPDGKRLAVSFEAGLLNLWGVPSPRLAQTIPMLPQATATPSGPALTPLTLAVAGTPLPPDAALIAPENMGALAPLAVWGNGRTQAGGCLALSPDGKRAVIGSTLGAYVYNVETRAWERFIPTEERVEDAFFSPDGQRLALRQGNRLGWYTADSAQLSSGFTSPGRLGPDGRTLVWKSDHAVHFADAASGELVHTFSFWELPDEARIDWLALSQAGDAFAVGIGGQVRVADAATGRVKLRFSAAADKPKSWGGAFSPDGQELALFVNADKTSALQIIKAATGDVRLTLAELPGRIVAVAYSADGRRLMSVEAKAIHVWEAASGAALGDVPGEYERFVFSADGLQALTSSEGVVRLYDLAGASSQVLAGPDALLGLAYSLDGKALAVSNANGEIQMLDPATGGLLKTLSGHHALSNRPAQLAFSPDGRFLASIEGGAVNMAGLEQSIVQVWDVASGDVFETLDKLEGAGHILPIDKVQGIAFSPDSSKLGVVFLNYLLIYTPADRRARLVNGPPGVTADRLDGLAFSPDGRYLVLNGRDQLIVLDAQTEKLHRVITLNKDEQAFSMQFSPDGKLLAAGLNAQVRLWDPASGAVVRTITNDQNDYLGDARQLAFSPDGRLLVGGSGTLRIWAWDVATGKLISTLQSPRYNSIDHVAFSPDGRRLVTLGRHGGVMDVWGIQP